MKRRIRITTTIISLLMLFLYIQNTFADGGAAPWSYYGSTGPEFWGDLDPIYRIAKEGKEQTPINIDFEHLYFSDLPRITLNYGRAYFTLIHNGHTIKADLMKNLGYRKSGLFIGNKFFDLAQFHFHTPSEHTINDGYLDMEMHLVHKADDNELAVIGVLIQGETNPGRFEQSRSRELEKVLAVMPTHNNETVEIKNPVNINALLPRYKEAFRYDGSLTTPPCTEGVNWVVMYEDIVIDQKLVSEFKKLFSGEHFPKGNIRPIQPINARKIKWDIYIQTSE